jgi:hypothetical protein
VAELRERAGGGGLKEITLLSELLVGLPWRRRRGGDGGLGNIHGLALLFDTRIAIMGGPHFCWYVSKLEGLLKFQPNLVEPEKGYVSLQRVFMI